MRYERGFTLAEVLITLGIIGVIAAMTIPVLVQNYKKHIAETRLKAFYSTINQALKLSENYNGDYREWDYSQDPTDQEKVEDWYNRYFKDYIKVLKTEITKIGGGNMYRVVLYLPNSSLVVLSNVSSVLFYPEAKNFKLSNLEYYDSEISYIDPKLGGIKFFTFEIDKIYGKGIVPYGEGADINTIINNSGQGCSVNSTGNFNEHAYCARYIMMNGWKIPKDYPLKF